MLEPGESATLDLPVTNVGDGTATGVSVVLTDDDPLTTIAPRARAYGSLAAGATRSRPFRVTLADAYPLGKPLALSARVTFAGTLSPTTATLSFGVGRPAGRPDDVRLRRPGPSRSPTTARSAPSVTIPVSGIGYAADLELSIDGATCTADVGATTVGIDHTYVGDLTGTLTSPGGATATLFQRSGSGGNNLCQVVFDDAAETPFTSRRGGGRPVHRHLAAADAARGPADRARRRRLDVQGRRRRGRATPAISARSRCA